MTTMERYDKKDPVFRDDDHEYFNFYRNWILPKVEGKKVLDIGCGQGWLTKEIAALPSVEFVIGVDRFDEQPEETKDEKIRYIASNIPGFETDEKFNTIVSTEFLEHIVAEDQQEVLKFVVAHLEPNGVFLGSMPDVLEPSGNKFHLREWSLAQWGEILRQHFSNVTQRSGPGGLQIWQAKI